MVHNRYVPVLLLYVPVQFVCMYSHQSTDQPGKVAKSARGQLNRENEIFPYPCSRLRIWSRKTGLPVPSCVSLLIFHTQAEFGAGTRTHE